MEFVKLNNGVIMPQMGYGVYQIAPDMCEKCVANALSVGYRMIDTAQAYHNEEGVGRAVVDSGIPRDEISLDTGRSLFFDHHSAEAARMFMGWR